MPHINSKSAKPAIVLLVLALVSVMLAACGGSSNPSTGSSTSTSTSKASESASATTPTTSTAGPKAGHSSKLRECLQKEGVTLPKREPGKGGRGFFGGAGGAKPPAGESLSKLRAALKKCGGAAGGFTGGGHFFNSPAVKQAYAKFASCMRANGVNLPEPNTSGKGPVFNTKGIETSSSTFKSAEAKCRSDLVGAFRVRPGIHAGAGASGAGASGAGGAAAG
ncbi:MAG TPA: hypothetical protein VMD79_12090 [Solirubrobacteraceae bacterium]|nr:hypothetical protein [Solirubrobacteraceae bacterium]